MLYSLRSFQEVDAADLVSNANNPRIANFMKDVFPNPYTIADANWFIEFSKNNTDRFVQAICIDNVVCGSIGLHFTKDILRNNAEIGYWLGETHWRKGIMTKAINEMVNYGFESYSISRIFARVYGNNSASQAVLKKCNFQLEARFDKTIIKNGELLDELIFAIRK